MQLKPGCLLTTSLGLRDEGPVNEEVPDPCHLFSPCIERSHDSPKAMHETLCLASNGQAEHQSCICIWPTGQLSVLCQDRKRAGNITTSIFRGFCHCAVLTCSARRQACRGLGRQGGTPLAAASTTVCAASSSQPPSHQHVQKKSAGGAGMQQSAHE